VYSDDLLLCCLYDVKAEQEVSEMSYQLDEMSTRLEEADGLTGAQVSQSIFDFFIITAAIIIITLPFRRYREHWKLPVYLQGGAKTWPLTTVSQKVAIIFYNVV